MRLTPRGKFVSVLAVVLLGVLIGVVTAPYRIDYSTPLPTLIKE